MRRNLIQLVLGSLLIVSYTRVGGVSGNNTTLSIFDDATAKLTDGWKNGALLKSGKVSPAKLKQIRKQVGAPWFKALKPKVDGQPAPDTVTLTIKTPQRTIVRTGAVALEAPLADFLRRLEGIENGLHQP